MFDIRSLNKDYMKKKHVFLCLTICFLLTNIACTGKQHPNSVRIAYLPVYSNLPLFVAVENGFFESKGLEVELIRFESSPNVATALVNDEVDMAGSVAFPTVLSVESRDPGKLKVYLASGHTKQGYFSSLVAMPSSGITEVEDLKGRTVGIFPGPSARVFFGLLFEKHGLNSDSDLNLVELASELQLEALASGQIDALATFEPIATQAVIDYGAIKFLPAAIESEVVEPWHGGVSVITSKFLTENPEAATQVIEALYEAVDYIRLNPGEAKQALNEYTGISPIVADETPSPAFLKVEEIVVSGLQEQADILHQEAIISHSIDVSELLTTPKLISNED